MKRLFLNNDDPSMLMIGICNTTFGAQLALLCKDALSPESRPWAPSKALLYESRLYLFGALIQECRSLRRNSNAFGNWQSIVGVQF